MRRQLLLQIQTEFIPSLPGSWQCFGFTRVKRSFWNSIETEANGNELDRTGISTRALCRNASGAAICHSSRRVHRCFVRSAPGRNNLWNNCRVHEGITTLPEGTQTSHCLNRTPSGHLGELCSDKAQIDKQFAACQKKRKTGYRPCPRIDCSSLDEHACVSQC